MEQASIFIEKLASTGENVLLNFDNFLTVDDVIKGRKDSCFKWHIVEFLYYGCISFLIILYLTTVMLSDLGF